MTLEKTRLHILRKKAGLSSKAKTGVSMHCHTEYSKEMLDFIGAKTVEEIYAFIPEEVRMKNPLNLPQPFTSEMELKKHA